MEKNSNNQLVVIKIFMCLLVLLLFLLSNSIFSSSNKKHMRDSQMRRHKPQDDEFWWRELTARTNECSACQALWEISWKWFVSWHEYNLESDFNLCEKLKKNPLKFFFGDKCSCTCSFILPHTDMRALYQKNLYKYFQSYRGAYSLNLHFYCPRII